MNDETFEDEAFDNAMLMQDKIRLQEQLRKSEEKNDELFKIISKLREENEVLQQFAST